MFKRVILVGALAIAPAVANAQLFSEDFLNICDTNPNACSTNNSTNFISVGDGGCTDPTVCVNNSDNSVSVGNN